MAKQHLKKLNRACMIDDSGTTKLDKGWFQELYQGERQMNPIIIGIDEVGRGCVYGPLVVCGVANLTGWHLAGVKDSKKIRLEHTRNVLANEIRHATVWTVVSVDAEAINKFGTEVACKAAGRQVAKIIVDRLRAAGIKAPIRVIFDGDDHENATMDGYTIESIVKADDKVFEVSAASILAKVTRDNWVHEQVKKFPDLRAYDLDSNKGYGTPKHKAALQRLGMTKDHRVRATQTLLDGQRPRRAEYETRRIAKQQLLKQIEAKYTAPVNSATTNTSKAADQAAA